MGDVAQILGDTANLASAAASSSSSFGMFSRPVAAAPPLPPRAIRMAGMSKEVMDLLTGGQDASSAALPPIVPAFNRPGAAAPEAAPEAAGGTAAAAGGDTAATAAVKVGTKWISSSKRARPWTWAPFASSSRTDGATFRHWVRAGVEYTDYPYAKFDVHLDPVVYTEDEYRAHLQQQSNDDDASWTKSETDRLMELARTYELRWPVIHDRWCDYDYDGGGCDGEEAPEAGSSSRKIEDLQHRYYGVAATLAQVRISQEAAHEAQSLAAAAAAASAAAGGPPKATIAGPNSGGAAGAANSIHNNKKTEAVLLEAAAARALATSAGRHQPLIANIGTGSTNKLFDVVHERERRHQMDRMWARSKEEEAEELELRRELKLIDAQLRKLKKSGGHIAAAAAAASSSSSAAAAGKAPGQSGPGGMLAGGFASGNAGSRMSSAASSRNPSRSVSPAHGSTLVGRGAVGGGFVPNPNLADDPAILDQSFASTAPVPMPHTPYLQSGRLVPPAMGGSAGLNKALLNRMDQVLTDLSIPARPLPTKRVCDVYDSVRKDILTLITLQKLVFQKEGQLQAKRVKLSKLGVSTLAPEDKVLDEERLLGITPPPKPPTPAATPAASKPKPTKKKAAASGGAVKAKAPKKSASAGPTAEVSSESATTKTKSDGKEGGASGAAATVTVKKKNVKRKRKTETSKSPTPASAAAATAAGRTAPPANGAAAGPSTNPPVPGMTATAPSKKVTTAPAPVASATSKSLKVATSATSTTLPPAKATTSQAASATPAGPVSSDTGKQSGGAKKRARKS